MYVLRLRYKHSYCFIIRSTKTRYIVGYTGVSVIHRADEPKVNSNDSIIAQRGVFTRLRARARARRS